MSNIAISAENVGKKYSINHEKPERYTALRDVLSAKAASPFRWITERRSRRNGSHSPSTAEEFWALKDVSFEVKQGEVVGVIGRNGAGKSTLLKIFSRITDMTEGRVRIRGTVASLLEVGTGFHQELTGRENIFVNGAILGMTRADVKARFEEIVAFAEVEKFLDTPVKRYSSGMHMRLAFAVAAHLEPEILIVDEVLAVGDTEFQKKCLGKMQEVAGHGRTVLFVSHNMHAVQQLTQKCLFLAKGRVLDFQLTSTVVAQYLKMAHRESKGAVVDLSNWEPRLGNSQGQLMKLEMLDGQNQPTTTVEMLGTLTFRLTCHFSKRCDASFGILIHSASEEALLDLRNSDSMPPGQEYCGPVVVEATVRNLKLYPGEYLISPWINDYGAKQDFDYIQYCTRLTVLMPVVENKVLKLDPVWGKFYEESSWTIA